MAPERFSRHGLPSTKRFLLHCAATTPRRLADSSRNQVSEVTKIAEERCADLRQRHRIDAHFFSPLEVPVAKCSVSAEIWRAESRAPG